MNDLVALAQINVHVGNFETNVKKIVSQITKAKSKGASLVVFPELAVCGYPPRDLLELEDFIISCEEAIQKIAVFARGIEVVVGAPSRNAKKRGKGLFNSAYHLKDGRIEDIYHKSLLPDYDVFDEQRYFEPNKSFKVFHIKGHCFGVAICEDLWNTEQHFLYDVSPAKELKRLGAQTIINIAASPFSYEQNDHRLQVLKENAVKHDLSIAYCNHIGAQTELIFDGGSFFMDNKGEVTKQAFFFSEDLLFNTTTKLPQKYAEKCSKTALIHDALVLGIKDYFRKSNFKSAVVGLSGGIDSAVTLVLAARALGAQNVLGVLMPSAFSSSHSIDDAKDLAKRLNADHAVIPIEDTFSSFQKDLALIFDGKSPDVTEENLQARVRGTLLMAVSNKMGHILLNTSNKSEAAVGYGTLYGDMNGGLSVLGDVYKTEVFRLAKYINKEKEVIPLNTIVKPPSAELRPDQKDSDSLPDYTVLDAVLHGYIEGRKSKQQMVALGFDEALLDEVFRLVNLTEYKRYQTPPTLRISPKSFGMGRRMPIVAKY